MIVCLNFSEGGEGKCERGEKESKRRNTEEMEEEEKRKKEREKEKDDRQSKRGRGEERQGRRKGAWRGAYYIVDAMKCTEYIFLVLCFLKTDEEKK